MIAFLNEPSITTAKPNALFTQTIQMRDDKRVLGKAAWNTTSSGEGVVQVLELWIDPAIRRAGHGKRLMSQLIEQARALHKSHNQKLRRLWIGGRSQNAGDRSILPHR